MSFLRWKLTVAWLSRTEAVTSHTHTGCSLLARRFRIRTRLGSASDLKSVARLAACSPVMTGEATGVQHSTGAALTSSFRIATFGAPWIDGYRCRVRLGDTSMDVNGSIGAGAAGRVRGRMA